MNRRRNPWGKIGFSLIELMIVIAIMAIMTGGVALGIGLLRSSDAKGLVNEINSSLTTLRSENMAKSEPSYLHLYYYNGDYYIKMTKEPALTIDGTGRKIGSGAASVRFRGESDLILGSDSESALTFCIEKKDGAFVKGKINNTINDTELKPTSEIEVTSGSLSYKIILVRDTGRHYLES